ncbi:MAG: hypothetical protein HC819_07155 [Cyclobacteriaceae bacterium]|nr:hypothetical protein [Cyclobacteriaceae bacterium]
MNKSICIKSVVIAPENHLSKDYFDELTGLIQRLLNYAQLDYKIISKWGKNLDGDTKEARILSGDRQQEKHDNRERRGWIRELFTYYLVFNS